MCKRHDTKPIWMKRKSVHNSPIAILCNTLRVKYMYVNIRQHKQNVQAFDIHIFAVSILSLQKIYPASGTKKNFKSLNCWTNKSQCIQLMFLPRHPLNVIATIINIHEIRSITNYTRWKYDTLFARTRLKS